MTEMEDDNDDSKKSSAVDRQIEVVTFLMNARAEGRATNEEVDAAVSRMLELQRLSTSTNLESAKLEKQKTNELLIERDTANYDDSDDERTIQQQAAPTNEIEDGVQKREDEPLTSSSKRKRASSPSPRISVADFTIYEHIPLGQQGAKMMTTFGDGVRPKPEAVEATLLGARQMLQVAIQDARYIRRKQKQVFVAAKRSLRDKPSDLSLKGECSSELLFRAGESYDRLSYDPKCGFDIEELRLLFQEEMNAFSCWIELHDETKSSNEILENGEEVLVDDPKEIRLKKQQEYNGHLRSRAARFDIRTDQMNKDWYLNFSALRRGSFLPRGATSKTLDDPCVDEIDTKRGRAKQGTWAKHSIAGIRFLHWVGFDPSSALPPPDEITTQALAFLGYDFFGRIVEKAISLRIADKYKGDGKSKLLETVLELDDGEQLEVSDIRRALEDPDIKQEPLCGKSNGKQVANSQLYFGPGFEDRLEVELEEFVRSVVADSATVLSEEEVRKRNEEEQLFQNLAATTPQIGGPSIDIPGERDHVVDDDDGDDEN